MRTKARRSFWLDGMTDRHLVEACPYAPVHRWWTFRVGDVVEYAADPDERFTICRACYVPQCGTTTDEDRCQYARHHEGFHRYTRHAPERVGA